MSSSILNGMEPLKSDRLMVVFSNLESWMPEVYEFADSWNKLSR